MRIFLIIVGLLVSFYIFFWITGLLFINNTKRVAKKHGYTKESEIEYQRVVNAWQTQEEETRQEEIRSNMIDNAHKERLMQEHQDRGSSDHSTY